MSQLVGLCGYAGAGKDTVADYLVRAHGYKKLSFADPMRAMLGTLLDVCGIDRAWLTDRDKKELPVPGLGVSYREMAQTLGTEWGRGLYEDFWLEVARTTARNQPDAKFVVSDVRFPNEAKWLRDADGRLFYISRGVPPVRKHVSEQHAETLGGLTIFNNGTVAELEQHLYWMVQRGLLP